MTGLWWQAPELANHIQPALDHINEGRGWNKGYELHACDSYFRALDYLAKTLTQTSNKSVAPVHPPTQSQALAALLEEGIESLQQTVLLGKPSVEAFATLEPSVLDHSVAGMSQLLDDISDEVRVRAGEAHDEFKGYWTAWNSKGSRVVKTVGKLSRAVLVVRNNLAHGEKTRVGPDMERAKRNRLVAATVLPVLEDLVDIILDHPSHKLCAYGTLRPGQPNHHVIGVADESWAPVTLLNGEVEDEDGLPVLVPLQGMSAPAELLATPELPALWQRLDEFEEPRYQRVLGLYQRENRIGVANVYQKRERGEYLL